MWALSNSRQFTEEELLTLARGRMWRTMPATNRVRGRSPRQTPCGWPLLGSPALPWRAIVRPRQASWC